MTVARVVFFIVTTVLVFSDSHFVSPFRKCYTKDTDCVKHYFQTVLWEIGARGVPEVGIPVLDPVVIKNHHTAVPQWVDLELVDGIGQGMRSCVVNKFWLYFEKRYASVEFVCDITVEGHYRIYSNSSLIRNFLNGDTIYGDGIGSIKIDKIKFSYDFNFDVERRGNEQFINSHFDRSKFDIDILGGVTFTANNLFLGQLEASDAILGVMNQYWKTVLDATGLPVLNEFCRYVYDITQKYLNNVPTSTYLEDDLSSYAVYRHFY